MDFRAEAGNRSAYTRQLRRDLHQHPELGFQEIRTAGIVASELESLGLEVTKGIAKTGVVALLEGPRPGPTLLLRFNMDALPIQEETGAEYASQSIGCMHACGHDGHTAIGLTVANILTSERERIAGKVKFCFQPSEESNGDQGIGGNELMIREGVLESPSVDMCLALHLWNEKPLGWLGIASGPVMAGAEKFKVRLTGKGGHGAVPNAAVDPVVASSQIISALQTIVSRNVAPLEAAVVSVTMMQAGTAFNIIPPEILFEGTIRSFDLSVRQKVLKRFDDIVNGIAGAMACRAEIDMRSLTPALVNNEALTTRVQEAARQILPEVTVDTTGYLTMGAEDMAFMLEKLPGCFFFIGSANEEKGLTFGHHHPKFDFDEEALSRGVALMAAAALNLLK